MSLPTNSGLAKNRGCNPVSSNCVVWQGPDLECIDLCKGDTVSEVIAKMAEELCELIDLFELEDYDFSCLGVPNSERPENIQELIQILIERICALEGIAITGGDNGNGATDCPENCIVPIASCFHYVNETGDTVTTMTLLDYVNAIGNRICDILDDITILQNEVQTLQDQMNGDGSGDPLTNPGGVVGEIGDIKDNKADVDSLQYVNSTKIDASGNSKYVTAALRSVETDYLTTRDALGTSSQIYLATLQQGDVGDSQRQDPASDGIMSSIPGWVINPENLSDAVSNLWKGLIDTRAAVEYIQENCCSTSCTDIFFNWQAQLTVTPGSSYITVYTTGSYGLDGWIECSGQTNVVVTDSAGNSASFKINAIALIDNPSGYQIELNTTPIDFTKDLTVVAETCFSNSISGSTCEKDYSVDIYSSADCPSVLLTTYAYSINYQFNATSGYSYIVNVYIESAPTPFATQIISAPGAVIQNSILGLTPDTNYELEVVIVNSSGDESPCPKDAFTTLPNNCTPPINASAILTTP